MGRHHVLRGSDPHIERPILLFFGADKSLLIPAQEYLRPIQYVFPLFLFNQMLAAFLRNDKNPGLATLAVLSGGIFNVFGDYFNVLLPIDCAIQQDNTSPYYFATVQMDVTCPSMSSENNPEIEVLI